MSLLRLVRSEVVSEIKTFNGLAAPTAYKHRLISKDYFVRCAHLGLVVKRDDGRSVGLSDDAPRRVVGA